MCVRVCLCRSRRGPLKRAGSSSNNGATHRPPRPTDHRPTTDPPTHRTVNNEPFRPSRLTPSRILHPSFPSPFNARGAPPRPRFGTFFFVLLSARRLAESVFRRTPTTYPPARYLFAGMPNIRPTSSLCSRKVPDPPHHIHNPLSRVRFRCARFSGRTRR